MLELSIVLVIIGLLIGGVFVGQSLIHNAQLNTVITEFNRYQTATQAFKQQYQGLPGDMNNVTSFWGVAGGTGSDTTCSTTTSTTTATCNGNGDGMVYVQSGHWGEVYRFWQHLSNAKMIEGSYTGSTTGHAANTPSPGLNAPQSKFGANVGWSIIVSGQSLPSGGFEGGWFNADYGQGHTFIFGTSCANTTCGAAITPKDGWAIDKKIDDGKPGMGNVIATEYANCTNAASMNDLGTTYKLATTSPVCALVFLANF